MSYEGVRERYVPTAEEDEEADRVIKAAVEYRVAAKPVIDKITDAQLLVRFNPHFILDGERVIGWTTGRSHLGKCDLGRMYGSLDRVSTIYCKEPADPSDQSEPTGGMTLYGSESEALADLRYALGVPGHRHILESLGRPDDETAVLNNPTPPPMPVERVPSALRSAFDGLTVRDVFAAHALQGVMAAHSGDVDLPDPKTAARWSREYADQLLAELADTPFS